VKKIIGIEWSKISSYGFFRVILILHFCLFLLVTFVFSRMQVSVPGFTFKNLFMFPNVWSTFAWVASWFNMLLAILVIVLTGNEFIYRTFRQQVLFGLSRKEFIYGRGILVLFLAVYSFVMVTLTGMVFGVVSTPDIQISLMFDNFGLIFVYMVQAIGYMIIGILLAVLFRNNSLAIIMYLLYFVLIEPIIRVFCPVQLRSWFPVKIISHLTPVPEILKMASSGGTDSASLTFERLGIMPQQLSSSTTILMAAVYIALFGFLIFRMVHKRDL
jgi:ABC-2 type transport system permease protein